jgi:hypothetical protein
MEMAELWGLRDGWPVDAAWTGAEQGEAHLPTSASRPRLQEPASDPKVTVASFVDYDFLFHGARDAFLRDSPELQRPWAGNVSPPELATWVAKHPPPSTRRSSRTVGPVRIFLRDFRTSAHPVRTALARRWQARGAEVVPVPPPEEGVAAWSAAVHVALAAAATKALAERETVAVLMAGASTLLPLLACLSAEADQHRIELAAWVGPTGEETGQLMRVAPPSVWRHRLGVRVFRTVAEPAPWRPERRSRPVPRWTDP